MNEPGTLAELEEIRWPHGPLCPHCGSKQTRDLLGRIEHQCNSCRRQFSVFTDTPLHGSHLTPDQWLWAVAWVVVEPRPTNISLIARAIDVRWRTACRAVEIIGDIEEEGEFWRRVFCSPNGTTRQ